MNSQLDRVNPTPMKTTLKSMLVVVLAALCCSAGTAQIIYSNNFALGAAVNISNTPPTVANSFAGGTNIAVWSDALGTNNTGALLANGLDNSTLGSSWLLPFTPQSGYIYVLTANVTFTNSPGSWIGVGFSTNYANNAVVGHGRFSDDTASGYDFLILTEASGNVQYFGGIKTANTIFNANNAFPPGPGTNTVWVILNTKTSPWSVAGYVNGVQMGKSFTYSSNPTIRAVGITQTTQTAPNSVQWNYLALSASQQPFITQQPISQSVSDGFACTNSVGVTADTNGGPLFYQWYANGAPLANSASISGANTNILIINPATTANNLTNYYTIVTNNYGSATSSLASLTVYTNPLITAQFPVATSPITLFGGANNYMGSSPTFSVSAVGAQPFVYLWLTNGVAVGGANNASFTFTNCQAGAPTTFSCIVSNRFGTAINTWSVSYAASPVAPYPQAVLASQPAGFWRLNESAGTLCNDYQSGDNGIYTNAAPGQTGYNGSESTETSVQFAPAGAYFSYAGQIQNVDFAVTNGANAEFAVEAWASCGSRGVAGGGPVVVLGANGANEAFLLGLDTNSPANYQFYVRTTGGTVYKADSLVPAVDFTWHHLVGVCDEANSNVSLYIDGGLVASTNIPAKSGLYEAAVPMSIGGEAKTGTGNNLQFFGFIDDVAAYRYPLSATQVAAHYISVSGSLPPEFTQTPAANVTVDGGGSLVIPATLIGSGPMGYYWTLVSDGTQLAAGATNGAENVAVLDATLRFPGAPNAWNGQQLSLTVTNAAGSTNAYVTLTVVSGAPQISTAVQPQFGAPLGGTGSDSVVAAGSEPFYYQWQFKGANLTDNGRVSGSQTSTLSVGNAQLSDQGSYQVIVTNAYGAVTSSVATFIVFNNLPVHFSGNGVGWTAQQAGTYTTPAITNGLLTLTDGAHNEARSFFISYPQYIGAFMASFTYQAQGGSSLADGATFCVQNDPRGAAVVGGIGGSLGVGVNGTTTAIAPSAELELHIYSASMGGVGYCFETNGIIASNLPPGNVLLTNTPVDVSIYYASGQMALTFSNEVGGYVFSTNLAVGDLTRIVNSNAAYVGFTGASGGTGATQTVSNFSFVSIPPVALKLSGADAVVSWPAAIGYMLQQTSDLTTRNWVTVTNMPAITNNQNQIILPAGAGNLFYRLILQ
jgi:hypothetical protein